MRKNRPARPSLPLASTMETSAVGRRIARLRRDLSDLAKALDA
jgi:hypothetical protein